MTEPVFVLGGLQTDFARNWARDGLEIADAMREIVVGGLEQARLEAHDVEVGHVGNFVAELFCEQAASWRPSCRNASGPRRRARRTARGRARLRQSRAAPPPPSRGRTLWARARGRHRAMRNVPGEQAAEYLGAPAMWAGHECRDARYLWPYVLANSPRNTIAASGCDQRASCPASPNQFRQRQAESELANAPLDVTGESFAAEDAVNPLIDGRIRK